MNPYLKLTYSGLFLLSIQNQLSAVGIEQTYHDPTAAARGNAFTATADNASAVHYNPAGLVWADSVTSQTAFYFARGKVKHTGGSGDFEHLSSSPTGAYFFNYPGLMDGRLALGLGITIPHGLGIDYGDDYPLRTLGTDAYLAHLVISPAASFKITDKLSLGMTLNYAYDDYRVEQGIITPGDSFKFEGTGKGWGYSLGVMYKPNDRWSFGANYRSSIKTNINGTATTTALLPAPFSGEEKASTGFDYPQQLVVGVAYKPNDKWLIEANVQWSDWTSFDTFVLKQASGDLVAPQNFQDTVFVGLGASNRLNSKTKLNFGYLFSTPAAPAETYNTFIPNADLHILSVGVDYQAKDWLLSSTLLYNHARSRTITGSPTNPISGVNSDGKWESSGFILMLGATKTF